VLPGLSAGGSGGSHSIYQEVRGMRDIGVPASIALHERAWERACRVYDDAEEIFTSFGGLDELAAITADADVISATHFKSVAMVRHLRGIRDDFLPAYYVQDYEPFFVIEENDDLAEARASYTAIPDAVLFAKTHWLCNAVASAHGIPVARVEPSLDTVVFHARGERAAGLVRVTAMLRPRTPRRQPHGTIAILERLRRSHSDLVEVATFGCSDADVAKLTNDEGLRSTHLGLLRRTRVAELLRQTDVFLDFSLYQAFGRTALEAMACGATALVPRIGGAAEFVEHGVNALAIDSFDEGASYEALAELASDEERLRAMQRAAVETASGFSIVRAALSEYLLFDSEHRARFGARGETAASPGMPTPAA
jgi:glycosyltransferase involved in cell wall biosynthesis